MHYQSRRSRRQREQTKTAAAAFTLAAFCVSALMSFCLLQMAVHVAHGGRLTRGADILLNGLTTSQLLWGAGYCAAVALVSIAATAAIAISQEN